MSERDPLEYLSASRLKSFLTCFSIDGDFFLPGARAVPSSSSIRRCSSRFSA